MTQHTRFAFAFCAAFLSTSTAWAVPLAFGGDVRTYGTTSSDNPAFAGSVINDNLIDFDFGSAGLSPLPGVGGIVQNRVVRSTQTGQLIFAPRIRDTFNVEGGTFAVTGFAIEWFETFEPPSGIPVTIDVDFRTDGLGTKGFDRVFSSVPTEALVFQYNDPLYIDAADPPGRQETSLFPSILTNATDYNFDGVMLICGVILPPGETLLSGPTFRRHTIMLTGIAQPLPPTIPLPATGWLLLWAFGAIWVGRRGSRPTLRHLP